ncbi:hypothetical protein JX265_011997 [Neoarthrinium moseri]|uniref:Uncharacterized protein n=1 Tax=Neoarthrinium moseri TaxID=1658444 RepID=A0A9P9WBF6_9PEZI|nr:hypothetical protein JX265_011997 [Neoarthrinium moseri]
MLKSACLASLLAAATPALANTEKAIFLGPRAAAHATPLLGGSEDLAVPVLTPEHGAIRTHLEARFPSDAAPFGKVTWIGLEDLAEGQRYEVRVCWAATQPTDFRLDTYETDAVYGDLELRDEFHSSAREYVGSRAEERPGSTQPSGRKPGQETSVLYLRILAAADYYTTNKTLMNDVPPVLVDIILDPFVFNVLPQSLVPTVGYIIVVAALSWFLARRISTWVRAVATVDEDKKGQ